MIRLGVKPPQHLLELEKVLWGFDAQTDHNFEIVIADDGTREETRQLIERFARATDRPIQHIWQEDDGFQKCRILNKAIVATIALLRMRHF